MAALVADRRHDSPNADLCALRERTAGRHRQSAGSASALLYRGNQDTYFRLHGTNEPDTIGTKVSSGCIRLFNHDIIDLYNRVPVGAPVVVLQEGQSPLSATAGAGGYSSGGYGPGGYGAGVMQPVVMDRAVMDRAAMERAVRTGWL